MMMIRRAITIAILLFAVPAYAQSVQQGTKTVTPGHAAKWITNGIIGDAGGAAGGPAGTGLTELGVTGLGLPFCINSGITSSPYYQTCMGANADGNYKISFNPVGGASPIGLIFNINGTNYAFPSSGAGSGNVVGPASSTPQYVPTLNNSLGTLLTNGAPTGNFWTNTGSPLIDRLGDRVVIGLQTNLYDGTNVTCSSSCTWVGSAYSNSLSYLEKFSQTLDYSQNGEMAATFASRSGDNSGGTTCCSIAVAAISNNTNIATTQPAWGYYATTLRASGAGDEHASELHVTNLGSDVVITPYGGVSGSGGATLGSDVYCGGEVVSTNPCDAAFHVGGGGGLGQNWFHTGLLVDSGSLKVTSDHGYEAIGLPDQSSIAWYEPTTHTIAAFIQSTITSAANQESLVFAPSGNVFLDGGTFIGLVLNSNVSSASQITFAELQSNHYSIGKTSSDDFFINHTSSQVIGINHATNQLTLGAAGTAVNFAAIQTNASTPSNFTADKVEQVSINGTTMYIPARTTPW